VSEGKVVSQQSPSWSAIRSSSTRQLVDGASSEGENIPPVDLANMPGLDTVETRRYAGLALRIPQDGLLSLIEAGLEDEIAVKTPIGLHGHESRCKETWRTQCSRAFCQMDEQPLLTAVSGNVAKAYKKSSRDGTSLARPHRCREQAGRGPRIVLRHGTG
jgi:hypothetical protein